ncbi:hypothetical protein [Desulforamulus ruminis]|uniref:hypothetical protein n=1 Tax=Desulforamulus ruminis TaxID=1564 RepID=UPI0023531BA2|nr:hypothetical protein [Desulforamulus ruminis]
MNNDSHDKLIELIQQMNKTITEEIKEINKAITEIKVNLPSHYATKSDLKELDKKIDEVDKKRVEAQWKITGIAIAVVTAFTTIIQNVIAYFKHS